MRGATQITMVFKSLLNEISGVQKLTKRNRLSEKVHCSLDFNNIFFPLF